MDPPAWTAHLPEGMDPGAVDLLAEESLPAAWRRRAEEAPDRPALWAAGPGWLTRGALEQASRRVAGRFHRAGLAPGERVLCSAATSMELVVDLRKRQHDPRGPQPSGHKVL